MNLCDICEKRRAKRYCPGIRNEICPICCGQEREVSVDCPWDCEYLQEARRREKPRQVAPEDIPNRDIEVTDRFLRQNEPLLMRTAHAVLEGAAQTSAVDTDIREALAAMIKTYLTRESGIIYESRSSNPYAAAVQEHLRGALEEFLRQMAQQTGMNTIRDKDVLGVLVFLQRVELHENNGRPRSRAFLDFLRMNFGPPPGSGHEPAGPVIATP